MFRILSLSAFAAASCLSTAAWAEPIYAINNGFVVQTLTTFDSETQVVSNTVNLTGFGTIPGEQIQSIDVRPATGELFGYTSNNRIVVINPVTGGTSIVGTATGIPSFIAPSIDFNPTVDRIRLVSGTNNFRINPNDATVTTDGSLAFSPGDTNAGDNPNVVAAGYTNSLPGATVTTLFDLEAGNDILVTQTPANAGLLQTVGAVGVGIANGGGFTGFDISGPLGIAYLVGNSGTGAAGLATNSLYTVDLATGLATLQGPIIGFTGGLIRDIAVVNVPEPASALIILGAAGFTLLRRRRTV